MAIKFVNPLVSVGKTNVTTQKWGNKYSANGKYHLGVDLATNGGKKTTVVAITGGTVVRTMSEKASGGWGNFVIVEHTTLDGRKLYSGYGHLASIYVKVGDEVEAGSELGLMGSTGNSTGPHVHFEIHYNDKVQNPMNFVG
jgi:murein DD-endopeptidase MepM/ murein hydrolase activator NlpD